MSGKFNRLSSTVILISEEGDNLGTVRVQDAKKQAQDLGLDLVEVGNQNNMSVCRIMDEGKWKYEQKKRHKQKKQNTPTLKEVKFGIRIDKHDREIKVNRLKEFLLKMHPVNIVVKMKGREKAHPEMAYNMLNGVITELEKFGKADGTIRRGGNGVSIRLIPIGYQNAQTEQDSAEKNQV